MIKPKPELVQKGDIFFIESHTWLGKFINWGQRLLSDDGSAKYNHSGIFLTGFEVDANTQEEYQPTTIESLWRVQSHDFFERYKDKQVYIVRPIAPMEDKEEAVAKIVEEDMGEKYPAYRFFYLIAPPLAKYVNAKAAVCSGLTAKYLGFLGSKYWSKYYQGTTPDKIVDRVRHHDLYEDVAEGIA